MRGEVTKAESDIVKKMLTKQGNLCYHFDYLNEGDFYG